MRSRHRPRAPQSGILRRTRDVRRRSTATSSGKSSRRSLLSLLIFTFILEIPPVMEQLESLVSKGVSWRSPGRMLLTLIPQALGLTIPMALLVGLLIGLGRLSGDREAVALLACGVSPYRLLRPVMAADGGRRGRPPVCDDLGDPGRQPDLPGDHLRRGLQAGRKRRPAAGVLRELSRAGSSTRGTSRPTAAGGGTSWSPTPQSPDARSCSWPGAAG